MKDKIEATREKPKQITEIIFAPDGSTLQKIDTHWAGGAQMSDAEIHSGKAGFEFSVGKHEGCGGNVNVCLIEGEKERLLRCKSCDMKVKFPSDIKKLGELKEHLERTYPVQ